MSGFNSITNNLVINLPLPPLHLPHEGDEDVGVFAVNFPERQLGVLGPHVQRILKDSPHRARAVVHVDGSL